jgi:glycosyltransferase involved in cell wall biosynthesis
MLSIAIIIPELRKYGGAEKLLIECLARWQYSHDVTLYTSDLNEEIFPPNGLPKIKIRKLSPRFEGQHSALLNSTLLPKIWEAEIFHHDIYHTHLWPTHLLDLRPMVWYPHEPLRLLYDLRFAQSEDQATSRDQISIHFYPKQDYDLVERVHYDATLRALEMIDRSRWPDRVVANSVHTAKYLESIYGTPVTDVVYPGATILETTEQIESKDVVLAIGQLWSHKRTRLVIEAMTEVADTELQIIGSGPEREKLQRIVDRLGLADRVVFCPQVDEAELQALLLACLCVVFVPVREPFGIVPLEALAAGKPLIAVAEGGFSEVIDERCALLVPPEPSHIARAIQQLKDQPSMARAMGVHGRAVARDYSWDRTARELLGIIEQTHAGWAVTHPPPIQQPGTLFAIHYFLWYREGFGNAHWSDDRVHGSVSDTPQLGYYSSSDGETLRAHLDLIEGMGIDVIVLNIHIDEAGLDVFQLDSARKMQSIAALRGSPIRFLPNVCLYTRDFAVIETALHTLKHELALAGNWLQIDGRQAIAIFWTRVFDGDSSIIDHLGDLTDGFFRISVNLRPIDARTEFRRTKNLFHTYSQFSPLELSSAERWEDIWAREYENSRSSSGLHCATITPGYDDTDLENDERAKNPYRQIDRAEGATYRRTMKFVLGRKVRPALVFMTSFNEFHENSHVEPSKRYGSRYVEMTRDFISEARTLWRGSGPDPSSS